MSERPSDREDDEPAEDTGRQAGSDEPSAEAPKTAQGSEPDDGAAESDEGSGASPTSGAAGDDEPGTGAADEAPADAPQAARGSELGDSAAESDENAAAPPTRAAAGDDEPGTGAAAEPPTAAGGAPPPWRGHPWLTALALLVAVVAVTAAGAAGYLGWRLQRIDERVAAIPQERSAALEPLARRSEVEALEQRINERLQSAMREKAKELAAARQEGLDDLRAGLDAVRERMATVEQGVRQVRELAARDQVGWRLAEIRYLLAVAQRRLLIARDTGSAIAALESADRAIAELGSVRLLPLRQRIVDDLAALRAVEPADVEGIALRLQNLLGRVAELPVADADDAADDTADKDAQAPADGDWWRRLTAGLERFVSVRRRDSAPDPGQPRPATELPEADELVLALERARQAALERNPTAFQRALAQADQALSAGFAIESDSAARFRSALSDLRGRRVVTELPALEETLALADRLSARLESEGTLDDSPEAGSAAAADGGDDAAETGGAASAEETDGAPAPPAAGDDTGDADADGED